MFQKICRVQASDAGEEFESLLRSIYMCFKKNVQASDAGEEFESKLELSKKLENQSGKKKLKQKKW